MNAVIDAVEQATLGTDIATPGAPAYITTTLYELMAALQTVGEPDEDELLVAIVDFWVHTGRITFCRGSTRERGSVAHGLCREVEGLQVRLM